MEGRVHRQGGANRVTDPEGSRLPPLLRAVRPKQWVKNVLVLAAPLSSARILEVDVLVASLIAFVAFSLAASGVYLLNDVRDVDEDRAHPTKRFRPIAAGELRPRAALIVAGVVLILSGVVAAAAGWALLAVVATYVVMSFGYSLALKAQPVIDLAIIAAGFVLRALAGGVAADIEFSPWFLLVAGFGSLFMAAGKRFSELRLVGEGNTATRASLGGYTRGYLRFVWALSATISVMTYCLWAIEVAESWPRPVLAQASIVPFVLGVLRYAIDVEGGRAGAPEEVVLSDRVLQVLGLVWLVLFVAGVLDG
jgi:decaprenyl-phosphate phosphoribosyltransferase